MNKNEIHQKLLEIVSKITQTTYSNYYEICNISLSNDLKFDSLQFVQLIVEVESCFGVEIDDIYLELEILDRIENIEKILFQKKQ